jgi:uncharacterized membrane protein
MIGTLYLTMTLEIPEAVKTYSQFLHPIFMWVLFGLSFYAMYLGFQIRRTRNAEKEERKELVKKDFNTRHFNIGAILLAFLVVGSINGMAVTYINNGKLFVGPHLIVGLTMTGLVALSAALSPLMQKGKTWARYTHITLNIALVGLFGWQAVSGMNIVQKILENL